MKHDEFRATNATQTHKNKHKLKATVGGKTQVKIITPLHHHAKKKEKIERPNGVKKMFKRKHLFIARKH